jgi:uncharacterized protein YecT (DUF1311 family)
MNVSAIISILALGVVMSAAARADYTDKDITDGLEQCKKSVPVNRIEVGFCEEMRRLDVERRLNSAYQKLIASFRERGEQSSIEHLRKAQRAWIKFREASCELDPKDGSSPFDRDCMAAIAEDRILYFEGHISSFCENECSGEYKIPACKVR